MSAIRRFNIWHFFYTAFYQEPLLYHSTLGKLTSVDASNFNIDIYCTWLLLRCEGTGGGKHQSWEKLWGSRYSFLVGSEIILFSRLACTHSGLLQRCEQTGQGPEGRRTENIQQHKRMQKTKVRKVWMENKTTFKKWQKVNVWMIKGKVWK